MATLSEEDVTSDSCPDPEVMELFGELEEAIIRLCDSSLAYELRIDLLTVAWNSVAILVERTTYDGCKNLMHWILRHTLHIMLVGEWTTQTDQVCDEIRSKIKQVLPQIVSCPNSINRCLYILKHFDNPWGDRRLLAVLHGNWSILTQSDIDYLTAERGCMIVLRLQKLCENKCEELAFTWSSKALMALRSGEFSRDLRKSSSVAHIYFIFDLYLGLLHKYIGVQKFIEEVERLELDDALKLIRRNINVQSECSRIIKLRSKVANLSAKITIASLMITTLTRDNEKLYCDILREWLNIQRPVPLRKFRETARKLFLTASSSKHLCLACRIIKTMQIPDWSDLLLELYVSIITGDLNELELLKSEKTCSAEVIIENEVSLSHHYLNIADLLKSHHPYLTYECILTAFSLNPTTVNYNLVKMVAFSKESGDGTNCIGNFMSSYNNSSSTSSTVSNENFGCQSKSETEMISNQSTVTTTISSTMTISKFSTETSITTTNATTTKPIVSIVPKFTESINDNNNLTATSSSSTLSALHSITDSNKILESPNYDALAAPNLILDLIDPIDLPDHIRTDLSVLLSSPRVKFLSWIQPWSELDSNCQRLLKVGGKLEIVRQSLAVANDYLQYLNLDYDKFRNLPEGDVPGIEKGYEHFADSDEDGTFDDVISSNTDSDVDYVEKGGSTKRKRQTKRIPKTKRSKSGTSAIALKKQFDLSQFDPIRQNLSAPFAQLLQQQPNLMSPFNNYLIQHLARRPNSNIKDLTPAELDALFRSFYIQQLQAQLKLSQTYTQALQQTLSPERSTTTKQSNSEQFQFQHQHLGHRSDRHVMPPPPSLANLKIVRRSPIKFSPKSGSSSGLPSQNSSPIRTNAHETNFSLISQQSVQSDIVATKSQPSFTSPSSSLATIPKIPFVDSQPRTSISITSTGGVLAANPLFKRPGEITVIKAPKPHVVINNVAVPIEDLPQARLSHTNEIIHVITPEIQNKLAPQRLATTANLDKSLIEMLPNNSLERIANKDLAIYRNAATIATNTAASGSGIVRTVGPPKFLSCTTSTGPLSSFAATTSSTAASLAAILKQQQQQQLRGNIEPLTSQQLLAQNIDPNKVIFVKRIVPAKHAGLLASAVTARTPGILMGSNLSGSSNSLTDAVHVAAQSRKAQQLLSFSGVFSSSTATATSSQQPMKKLTIVSSSPPPSQTSPVDSSTESAPESKLACNPTRIDTQIPYHQFSEDSRSEGGAGGSSSYGSSSSNRMEGYH